MFEKLKLKRLLRKRKVSKQHNGDSIILYVKQRNAGAIGIVYDIREKRVTRSGDEIYDVCRAKCLRDYDTIRETFKDIADKL